MCRSTNDVTVNVKMSVLVPATGVQVEMHRSPLHKFVGILNSKMEVP